MEKIPQQSSDSHTLDLSKGQKIVAALYLVTKHLPENDPIKTTLRARAVDLLDLPDETHIETSEAIVALLGAAVLAKAVNQNNATIIIREVSAYYQGTRMSDIAELFATAPEAITSRSNMSFMSNTMSVKIPRAEKPIEIKSNRQDRILSFINQKKSAAIKDIATLFPDVSEKTIQRELGTLVTTGKIKKHGNKRWSIYMSIA